MDKLTINTITLSGEYYKDRNELFNRVGNLLNILFENEYVCKIKEDENEAIIIEFGHDNRREYQSSPILKWNEMEDLLNEK